MHITTQEIFTYTQMAVSYNEWMDTHGHVELTIGSAFNGRVGECEIGKRATKMECDKMRIF